MKVITLELVREREADPAVDGAARARLERVNERLRPHLERMNQLSAAAKREPDYARKLAILREIAGYLAAAMAGVVPCSSGCSHCCYTPVMLTRVEAGVIGQEIGVPAKNPAKYSHAVKTEYIGTPCPFLKGGACSIYDSRPMACRVHFNLDADNLLCHLFAGESIKVPYFDNLPYHLLAIQALGLEQSEKIADIRDYFPNKKG